MGDCSLAAADAAIEAAKALVAKLRAEGGVASFKVRHRPATPPPNTAGVAANGERRAVGGAGRLARWRPTPQRAGASATPPAPRPSPACAPPGDS
jgi:hypothetical protein